MPSASVTPQSAVVMQNLRKRFPEAPEATIAKVLEKHDWKPGLAALELRKSFAESELRREKIQPLYGPGCCCVPESSVSVCYLLSFCWVIDWVRCDSQCCSVPKEEQLARWRSRWGAVNLLFAPYGENAAYRIKFGGG